MDTIPHIYENAPQHRVVPLCQQHQAGLTLLPGRIIECLSQDSHMSALAEQINGLANEQGFVQYLLEREVLIIEAVENKDKKQVVIHLNPKQLDDETVKVCRDAYETAMKIKNACKEHTSGAERKNCARRSSIDEDNGAGVGKLRSDMNRRQSKHDNENLPTVDLGDCAEADNVPRLSSAVAHTTRANGNTIKEQVSTLSKLEQRIQTCDSKKQTLFQAAIDAFNKQDRKANPSLRHLGNEADSYVLKQNKKPAYFRDPPVKNSPTTFTSKDGFYDYRPEEDGEERFWVDFANKRLGGGCFGKGFVQEEIMCVEMPELADLVATGNSKREPWRTRSGKEWVLQGSPTPLVIKNVSRVLKIKDLYRSHELKKCSYKKLEKSIITLDSSQTVNILAMAAPSLRSKKPKFQLSSEAAQDLFNTFHAGFTLAKKQTSKGKQCTICSGNIGCGAFNNDYRLVYLLQAFAAQQTGVNLRLYDGKNQKEVDRCQRIWKQNASSLQSAPSIEEGIEIIRLAVKDSYRKA